MIRGKYLSAFLVPKGARKELTDCGWEFESDAYIPLEAEMLLRDTYRLVSKGEDISCYESENVKVEVFKAKGRGIENVYFRFFGNEPMELPSSFRKSKLMDSLEFFIPVAS